MSGADVEGRAPGTGARIGRGIVAGVIAGAVAAFAMDRFQAAASAVLPSGGGSDEPSEPATERAADAVAHAVGRTIADADKPLAGQAVHYALGIGLGVAYAIAAEFRPGVTAGGGSAFGIGAATLLDEAAVPAVGLGAPPWRSDVATTLYSYASHLVFGGTAELVRRQVTATLAPPPRDATPAAAPDPDAPQPEDAMATVTHADKQLAIAYFAAFRDRDAAWWDRHIAPDFVRHDPGLDFEVRGPEGMRKLAERLHGGFSDIAYPILQVVAEGDRVLVHLRQTATHSGPYQGTPATGRRTDIVVMDLFRIADGRLVEHWAQMDNLTLLKQIGAVEG